MAPGCHGHARRRVLTPLPIRLRNSLSSAEAALLLRTPSRAGLRVGAGAGVGLHWMDVSRQGVDTGNRERPVPGEDDPRFGVSALAAVEWTPAAPGRVRLELTAQRRRVDYGACAMNAWALCGTLALTRYTLGAGFRSW